MVFDEILDITKNSYNNMNIISLHLPKLCDHYYSNLVMKYILHTSILLNPFCLSVKNSTNTSLYAYPSNIGIKKSNYYFSKTLINYFKKQKIQETTPTISFIVPFHKMCKYQNKNYNPWNEMLFKPKSILFCNIDSNNFYQWWNFAAIIDFKWKTFGKFYYFLIWIFYTMFFICFVLAATLDLSDFHRTILFTISIFIGLIHLSFEIRQFLWNWKLYIKDPWNLFGK
jgi:hypothetical protein